MEAGPNTHKHTVELVSHRIHANAYVWYVYLHIWMIYMVNLAKYTKSSWILWENTVLFYVKLVKKYPHWISSTMLVSLFRWIGDPTKKGKGVTTFQDTKGKLPEINCGEKTCKNRPTSLNKPCTRLSQNAKLFFVLFFFKYLISVYCLIFLCMILSTLTLLNSILDFGAQVLNLQQNLRNHPTKNSGLKNRRYYR